MLHEIFVVVLCLFAVLGIVDTATYLFERLCSKKLPQNVGIFIPECKSDNAEYAIRFLEGVIMREGLSKSVGTLYLSENVSLDEPTLARLGADFGNIVRL